MFEFYKEFKARRAAGDKLKPVWKIVVGLILFPFYLAASALVNWMDNDF